MTTLNLLDGFIAEVDAVIRTLIPPAKRASNRPSPGDSIPDSALNVAERSHVAGLMRVNHAGEVCAQALYRGQALTAKLTHIKQQMNQAAAEETDHLAWCEQRLNELGSKPSLLNPLWYGGSLLMGAVAGIAGDPVSLGFVAETERQVSTHLQEHLSRLPAQDKKTSAIIARMQDDEAHHADDAIAAGAVELPEFIKTLMSVVSKLMTQSSYYI